MMKIPTLIDEAIRFIGIEEEMDLNILRSIIQQESNFNPHVLRFEPNYPYLLNPLHYSTTLGITLPTETVTQKISWGLSQIMGARARDLGFTDHMGVLLDVDTNVTYLCKNLNQIKEHAKTEEELFACYNGGMGALNKKDGKFVNQAYVDSCMNHLSNWRKV